MVRSVLLSCVLFCLYALLVALMGEVVGGLAGGHSRGVSQGITIYYSFLMLCFQGCVTIVILRRLPLKLSLCLTAAGSILIVFFMFPGMNRGALVCLAMVLGAMVLCSLYLVCEAKIRRQRMAAPCR